MANEPMYHLAGKRVWVAGHRGMVGSALVRRLAAEDCEVLTASRDELDLRSPEAVTAWVRAERPHAAFIAAAKVGGIAANAANPVAFLEDNLYIATNTIAGAYKGGVEKLLFLGSSCIYPRLAPQPITEDALLTGALEPTNAWYALAKIAGIKLTQAYRIENGCDFISAMPTNLYGPGDNFDLNSSHVLPALLRKTHEAKRDQKSEIIVWGTGQPRREFLHVDDCADALVHLMLHYSDLEHVNVGCGEDVSIRDLAELICGVVDFPGALVFDTTKPDGTPRKLLDISKLDKLGWSPRIGLRDGVSSVYATYEKLEGNTNDSTSAGSYRN